MFDIEMGRIEANLRRHFGPRAEAARKVLQKSEVFEKYERGEISTPDFLETVRHAAQPPISAEAVVEAWNSIFLEMPAEHFDFLLRLRQNFRVFLLSNINDLHARWIDQYLVEKHGIHDFRQRFFEKTYYSHEIGMRKPDPEIFRFVLHDANLRAPETFFVDDLKINVAAAESVGIRGIWHREGDDVLQLF